MTHENLWTRGYRMTIAEIEFRAPDCPDTVQCYTWQDIDIAPEYPVLRKFDEDWQRNQKGAVERVRVEGPEARPSKPEDIEKAGLSLMLH